MLNALQKFRSQNFLRFITLILILGSASPYSLAGKKKKPTLQPPASASGSESEEDNLNPPPHKISKVDNYLEPGEKAQRLLQKFQTEREAYTIDKEKHRRDYGRGIQGLVHLISGKLDHLRTEEEKQEIIEKLASCGKEPKAKVNSDSDYTETANIQLPDHKRKNVNGVLERVIKDGARVLGEEELLQVHKDYITLMNYHHPFYEEHLRQWNLEAPDTQIAEYDTSLGYMTLPPDIPVSFKDVKGRQSWVQIDSDYFKQTSVQLEDEHRTVQKIIIRVSHNPEFPSVEDFDEATETRIMVYKTDDTGVINGEDMRFCVILRVGRTDKNLRKDTSIQEGENIHETSIVDQIKSTTVTRMYTATTIYGGDFSHKTATHSTTDIDTITASGTDSQIKKDLEIAQRDTREKSKEESQKLPDKIDYSLFLESAEQSVIAEASAIKEKKNSAISQFWEEIQKSWKL